ncbi:MAG: hypothetical protein ACRDP1_00745 [Nocardioidaceae bacterium]
MTRSLLATDSGSGGAATSPDAVRLTRSRWRDPRLAVGVILVALAVVLGARVVAASDHTVAVWALAHDVPAGSRLTPDDVTVARVHFDDSARQELYVSSDETIPDSVRLTRAASSGELLSRAALAPAGAAGVAELPLAVASTSMPGDLRPGEVVDVWVAPRPGTSAAGRRAQRVLSGVRVASVNSSSSSIGGLDALQVVVTLDSGAADAGRLDTTIAAVATGTVVLVRVPE